MLKIMFIFSSSLGTKTLQYVRATFFISEHPGFTSYLSCTHNTDNFLSPAALYVNDTHYGQSQNGALNKFGAGRDQQLFIVR
jgi:hypothetical protein